MSTRMCRLRDASRFEAQLLARECDVSHCLNAALRGPPHFITLSTVRK